MPSVRLKGIQVALDIQSRDGRQLIGQGLATMVRVAQGEDIKHAVYAAEWLVRYGEQILSEKRVRPVPAAAIQQTREGLIGELRGLYARALGEAHPLIVETAAESVPEKPPER